MAPSIKADGEESPARKAARGGSPRCGYGSRSDVRRAAHAHHRAGSPPGRRRLARTTLLGRSMAARATCSGRAARLRRHSGAVHFPCGPCSAPTRRPFGPPRSNTTAPPFPLSPGCAGSSWRSHAGMTCPNHPAALEQSRQAACPPCSHPARGCGMCGDSRRITGPAERPPSSPTSVSENFRFDSSSAPGIGAAAHRMWSGRGP